MSAHESEPNHPSFDFDKFEVSDPSLIETYADIIHRYNDLLVAQERSFELVKLKKDFKLDLDIPVKGSGENLLSVTTNNDSRVHIGYYSPIQPSIFSPGAFGEFITYPEIVKESELPVILPQAHKTRASNIDDFNKSTIPKISRVDYDHPSVRELLKLQNDFLVGCDAVDNILYRHYESLPYPILMSLPIETDRCTTINVCLSGQESELVLNFFGSFYLNNDHKRRCSVRRLTVGKRDKTESAMEFTPVNELATPKELKILASLAIEAKVVGLSEENFSTYTLGIQRFPENQNTLLL